MRDFARSFDKITSLTGLGEKTENNSFFLFSTKTYHKTGNSVRLHLLDGQGKGV